MKRIATAAVAATLSMSALSAPAFAADADTAPAKENQGSSAQAEGDQAAGEKVGSSEVYKKCKEGKKAESEQGKDATAGKDGDKAEPGKEKGSNNATGECIQQLIDNPDTKPGILGLLIGVPLALVALLGAAAAFSGSIPGLSLPAIPDLPM
ncbi:hypothetical protein CAFEA_11020 [Corynebacterium afermentans subsp. afermentans]|uniref:Secreted protein n=1 Tax=Corynebacterium afermentans TaxID=38286 RepID=A0A9X8R4Y8_9CORY|nr:hypothetical protein [Corynebacterium afermentans]OAA17446.1 hypothetical protein Caferm_02705 [Corynebacterium afermentans subsp. afermentans]WJY57766.1 hypothetical protein CAFEA_11020 [Corynebacterium afermentans subsp. afermentans]SIQ40295.1 hypothetical protein SAMN05421802_11352 [Corynebacterium afermentans]